MPIKEGANTGKNYFPFIYLCLRELLEWEDLYEYPEYCDSLSMSRVGGERALRAPPPPPPAVLRCSPTPPSWLLRSEMDLVERVRGSLSRSTLLLRESILEAEEEGAREGRRDSWGGYREERRRRVGKNCGWESGGRGELIWMWSETDGWSESDG